MPQDTIQHLILDCCDPGANLACFSMLSIQASLFGDAALVRDWGRTGEMGQRKIELQESPERAAEALEMGLRRKQRQGYRLRTTCVSS